MKTNDLNSGDKKTAAPWRLYPLAALIALAGLATTSLITWQVSQSEQERLYSLFFEQSWQHISAVKKELYIDFQALDALRALFESSGSVSRAQFSRFTAAILRSHNDIQALEWIPRVARGQRADYEIRARQEGLKGFLIKEKTSKGALVPAAERGEYYPVYYLEPLAGNQTAAGYDLNSDPVRHQALQVSMSADRQTATRSESVV